MAAEDTQSRKPGSASKPMRRGIVTSSKTTVGRETCGLRQSGMPVGDYSYNVKVKGAQ